MAHSHIKQTVIDIRDRIKRSLLALETDQEMVIDALKALEVLELDLALINTTGIGNVLKDSIKVSKEKRVASVTEKANKIMSVWKSLAKSKTAHQPAQIQPAQLSIPDNEARKMILSQHRKKMVGIMTEQFMKKVLDNQAQAECVALNIEEAVNKVNNYESEKSKYSDKLKSISFNLTKNEELLRILIDGHLSFEKLATMSPAELASQHTKEERRKIAEEQVLSRRLDQEDIIRKDIQVNLGIDSANAWEYDQDDDAQSEPDIEAPDS